MKAGPVTAKKVDPYLDWLLHKPARPCHPVR